MSESPSPSPSPSIFAKLGEGKEGGLYNKEFKNEWTDRPQERKPLHIEGGTSLYGDTDDLPTKLYGRKGPDLYLGGVEQ